MFVKQFLTGGDRNYGYLAADDSTKLAAIIDPSYSPKLIYDFSQDNGYKIEYIFVTHNHSDHTNGNDAIKKLSGVCPLLLGDKNPTTGTTVSDGAKFPMGDLNIQIIHTPGHTSDSICVYIGDSVFTGDTLFVGKVGGTGYRDDARTEYDSLHNKLMKLPDSTRVFPGHNYGVAPESTILSEKKTNPFLLRPDIEAFIDLKRNWLEYKRIHNID
ncbi:MAG: MBL fold metallo-hydrolase [candidate division Zixibacteria bacterium]|nr:MBL fold metallo-hydrolase [candidate division Zixibacteria bacterium]